jgi:predicted MFS family arabinose efflux permease
VVRELDPDCGRATGVDSLTSLIWLTLGAFAIGTEGFMIAGLLPALARDLNVGLPAAGHLVTAFSLAYAIGAPVMAVLTAGLERRRLLAVAMGCFALGNLLAALAPGYAGLLAARLLLALSAATFMPAASGYAAALGGPERRGRALSTITTGLTLAIIAGVPLGVLVGQGFGWRATFFGVAGLAAFSLLGILTRLPRQPPGVAAGLGERLALAKRCDILGVLLTSVLTVAGTFTVYTYLGVFIAGVAGLGPQALAPVLLGFGLASAVGTQLSGSAADRWGARSTVIVGGGLALLAYLAFSLSAALGPARAMPVMLPAILLWGLASWGLITAQQARLVALAPALAAGQPLDEFLGHLPRQRNGCRSGRSGHCRWRDGAARLGGCGIRSGRAAVGAAQRQQHIRPRLMAAAMTSHRQLHHDHQRGPAPWFHGRAAETGSPARRPRCLLGPPRRRSSAARWRAIPAGRALSSPFPPHEAGLCLATGEAASMAGRDHSRLDACESNRGSRYGGPDAQGDVGRRHRFPSLAFRSGAGSACALAHAVTALGARTIAYVGSLGE